MLLMGTFEWVVIVSLKRNPHKYSLSGSSCITYLRRTYRIKLPRLFATLVTNKLDLWIVIWASVLAMDIQV